MTLKERANKFADQFESKAVRLVAFWSAMAGLLALIPTILAGLIWLYLFFTDIANISNYVKQFQEADRYDKFMIMQLAGMIKGEADPKESYGITVRMINPPEGHKEGDLYYFTYIKINDIWRPVIYGAFPNKTNKNVGILNIDGAYKVAGKELRPLDNH